MTAPIRPTDDRPDTRQMFRTLGIAASGLSAQRLRMETIALNVANAETTRTETGGPYRRRVVEMTSNGAPAFGGALEAVSGGAVAPTSAVQARDAATAIIGGVQVAGITEDPSEGPLVYQPGHPDANADGYVRYPNVRITDEMVDLMDARRLYEANATVFQVTKSMLRQAISI